MDASHKGVMYYHADACPVGGYVTQPFESVLKTEASVSLSPTGGHAAARAEKFHFDTNIFSGPVYSQATGGVHKSTGNWTTVVTAVVENLNVYEVVTADKIVSQISVEHRRDSIHPGVSFVGSQFENLRINGKPVHAAIDHALLPGKPGTGTAQVMRFPSAAWPEETGFVGRVEAKNRLITTHEKAPDWVKRRYKWMESAHERAQRGFAICSLVEEVKGTESDSTFGHVVHVPGFGNIFLAELIVDHRAFHLTMLRIEMGCLADGNISVASTHSNGSTTP